MNGQMWIKNQWTPQLQRFHDQSLMKVFSNIVGITRGVLDQANHYCMYIRYIIITDLANTRDKHIPSNRMNGEWHASLTLVWPRFPKLPAKYWEVFRRCIRKAFLCIHRPGFLKRAVRLDQPLGPWRKSKRHVQYQHYCTKDKAFLQDNNKFFCYTNPATRAQIFKTNRIVEALPPDAYPINASHTRCNQIE